MNIYAGNLSWNLKDQDLQNLFAAHGEVTSAKIVNDKFTGRSKGFGFVEMGSDAEAQAAISAMNGQQYGGRGLVVNEARPMEPRPPRSGGGGFGGGDDVVNRDRIFCVRQADIDNLRAEAFAMLDRIAHVVQRDEGGRGDAAAPSSAGPDEPTDQ